jgi:lysophospholipase L1-like esterase
MSVPGGGGLIMLARPAQTHTGSQRELLMWIWSRPSSRPPSAFTRADLSCQHGPVLIAALGSSFAAGPTLEPVADRAAMRSARNYPSLLAESLGAALVDLTVSGATVATILDVPQVIAPRVQFPPQIDGLPAAADLVTITTGGNDIRLIGSMMFIGWLRHEPEGPRVKLMRADHQDGIPVPTPALVEAVAAGLARIVAAVRSRAPRARVMLVDYLTVLDAESRSLAVEYAAEELAAFRMLQDSLVRAHALAAERSGAELLAMSGMSRGHGLGSAEPWVFDFIPEARRTAGSFRPNAAGMAAVAATLARHLGG